MKFYSLILILLFLNGNKNFDWKNNFQTEYVWELKKDKKDIKIYTRKSKKSNINEVKVITLVKASVSELVDVLFDINAYPDWVSSIESIEILKRVNSKEIIYYFEASVPWPFSNRDDVFHLEMKENSREGVIISFTDKPDYIPIKKKIVRIKKSSGIWKLTPKANGETEVEYQFLTDPGSGNPAWLVNMFIVDGPYQTMTNLKEFVKKKKY